MTTPQEEFREALLAVLGLPLGAAGYALAELPVQWEGGLFRFRCRHDETLDRWVAYQLLAHPGYPSRFQVILRRAALPGRVPTLEPVEITLPGLLWEGYGVRVLPAPDHWWAFSDQRTLGDGLLESGKLLVGYGLPWLDGSLVPGADAAG